MDLNKERVQLRAEENWTFLRERSKVHLTANGLSGRTEDMEEYSIARLTFVLIPALALRTLSLLSAISAALDRTPSPRMFQRSRT